MTPDTLLGVGYVLSIPATLAVLRIAWRRWLWAFVGLEVGTACVSAAWFLKGQKVPGWFNAGAGIGFLATYVTVGRVRRRRLDEP